MKYSSCAYQKKIIVELVPKPAQFLDRLLENPVKLINKPARFFP
jgi:hypothetical protein